MTTVLRPATDMNSIFWRGYPKEFGYKRLLIHSKEEQKSLVNKYNGKENIFVSIYRYPLWTDVGWTSKPVYSSAVISAVYFDIDNFEDSYQDMLGLHKWCEVKDIRHFVLFSGRGYHVFIFVEPPSKNLSQTLYSFSNYLEKKLNADFDNTAKGNLAKISRLPGTYNIKREAYCIPLTKYQIENMDFSEHYKLAQQPQFVDGTIGNKAVNISFFSDEKIFSKYKMPDLSETDIKPSVEDAIEAGMLTMEALPPCVSNMIRNPELNYDGRSMLIKYFTEFDYNYGQVREIFRNFLSPSKYKHALDTHIKTMFRNGFQKPVNCDDIKTIGMCPGCERNSPLELEI